MTFKHIRVALLLGVFAFVAVATWMQQRGVAGWERPLAVRIYPINGDRSQAAADYIRGLSPAQFDDVRVFIEDEAHRYGVTASPVVALTLGREIESLPPSPPSSQTIPAVMWWSLRLRIWAWRETRSFGLASSTVRIFALYHLGSDGKPLAHSLGLQRGLIGVAHLFANPRQEAQNSLVIAHELLHTLGASDKYGPAGLPIFPEGYGEPGLDPLHPQTSAEIMAGRLAVSLEEAVMPRGLEQCVVGPQTAREIHWLQTR